MNKEIVQIGELLKSKGLVSSAHIGLALKEQKITGEKVGEILERLGFVSQYDVANALSEQYGIPYVDVDRLAPHRDALALFNMKLCVTNDFLPLQRTERSIKIVTSNPQVEQLARLLVRQVALQPEFYIGERSKIQNAIQHYYYFLENPVESLFQREIDLVGRDADMARSLDQLISHLLHLAVRHRASDIHISPSEATVNLSFRIDGVMRHMYSMAPNLRRLVSTLKLKANMDIAEQRLPQDGSFSAEILNRKYDMRVSTTTGPYGENMVIRLLPMESNFMTLSQLGFYDEDVATLKKIFNQPYGIVLLTGPTGAGKTTTLFSAVRVLDMLEKHIVTVENPIEYRIPLVRQTEINTRAGYNFANAVRHLLRHDPDVILVGEIRDQETAATAVQASETGHLVLSTLHTNTAFGAIPRLRALGIEPFMLSESLVGVVGQRLVRRICAACKESYQPSEEERRYLGVADIEVLYRGRGCDACGHTGYFGRTAIYEILHVTPDLARQIGRGADFHDLVEVATKAGFKNMFHCGVRKVTQGETTVSELVRVLGTNM